MIKGSTLEILYKRYNEIEEDITFREFVEQQAERDPDFYRILFKEDHDYDPKAPLTERQLQAYKDFLDSI